MVVGGGAARRRSQALSSPREDGFLQASPRGPLAVVPIQEEQREGAHDQEEQDPDPEARVVFDRLEKRGYRL